MSMKIEHPALSEKDRPFLETVIAHSLAEEKRIFECLDLLGRARELGVRVELWEVLRDRGVLGETAISSARSVAEGRRDDLVGAGSPAFDATSEEERRLGELAVANFLLSESERDAALAAQEDLQKRGLPLPLGRILVDHGKIQRPVVEGLLYLQRAARAKGTPGGSRTFGEEDLRFGHLALENALVERSDLGAALREQAGLARKGIAKRIGQVLFERGSMSRDAVRSILRMQALRSGSGAVEDLELVRSSADGERLGELLERNRLAERAGIERALSLQADLRQMGIQRPLGQILLDLGLVDRDALEAALQVQTARRQRAPGSAPERPGPSGARPGPIVPLAGGMLLLALAWLLYANVDRGLASEREDPWRVRSEEDVIAGGQNDHRRLIESAERKIAEHEYAQAIAVLERLEIRVPEWRRDAEDLLDRAKALLRVLDELVARIDERPVQVVELDGDAFEVVGGGPSGIVVRAKDGALDRGVAWSNVGPEALARLLEAYEVPDQNPEGVLRFYLEHDLKERADRLAVAIIRRSPERREAVLELVGRYRGIADPVGTLDVEDGRLVPRGR